MSKTQGNFKLSVVEGEFTDSQIVVMLGENGTGKTTFIRMPVMPTHTFFMLNSLLSTVINDRNGYFRFLYCPLLQNQEFFFRSVNDTGVQYLKKKFNILILLRKIILLCQTSIIDLVLSSLLYITGIQLCTRCSI
jgi:ABC-type siderophore export system fused ATPase/permease subunit